MSTDEFLTREEFQSSMESLMTEIESLLNKPSRERKDWLRTTEAAEYLSISASQLHNLKSEGVISCTRLRGTNYYDREEIDQILEENKTI